MSKYIASSRFKGVESKTGGKTWYASFKDGANSLRCGTHATEEDAAHARDKCAGGGGSALGRRGSAIRRGE